MAELVRERLMLVEVEVGIDYSRSTYWINPKTARRLFLLYVFSKSLRFGYPHWRMLTFGFTIILFWCLWRSTLRGDCSIMGFVWCDDDDVGFLLHLPDAVVVVVVVVILFLVVVLMLMVMLLHAVKWLARVSLKFGLLAVSAKDCWSGNWRSVLGVLNAIFDKPPEMWSFRWFLFCSKAMLDQSFLS